jgi:hypothetical protein
MPHPREFIMAAIQKTKSDPKLHTEKIKGMLGDVIRHVRADVDKVSDPKVRALFDTTAEVLSGLVTAYDHFEQRGESAWK